MQPKILALKDKQLVDRFLALSSHELSVYNFANIYIWKELFDIRWKIIRDSLCIFFQDKIGSFLYLPPLGKEIKVEAVREAFDNMDRANRNKDISRIENIEESSRAFFRDKGYSIKDKFYEYLCLRNDLTQLKGDKFKPKRALFNYFTKHYKCEYLPFRSQDRTGCLLLYKRWAKLRRQANPDSVYRGMLEDSYRALRVLLNNHNDLGVLGRIVKLENKIEAFTFGFELNARTFSILYEITNLSIKGLAQFIFRQFCQELKSYQYINLMDDSGLENLKKVKLSYRPVRLVPGYIVTRGNG